MRKNNNKVDSITVGGIVIGYFLPWRSQKIGCKVVSSITDILSTLLNFQIQFYLFARLKDLLVYKRYFDGRLFYFKDPFKDFNFNSLRRQSWHIGKKYSNEDFSSSEPLKSLH